MYEFIVCSSLRKLFRMALPNLYWLHGGLRYWGQWRRGAWQWTCASNDVVGYASYQSRNFNSYSNWKNQRKRSKKSWETNPTSSKLTTKATQPSSSSKTNPWVKSQTKPTASSIKRSLTISQSILQHRFATSLDWEFRLQTEPPKQANQQAWQKHTTTLKLIFN